MPRKSLGVPGTDQTLSGLHAAPDSSCDARPPSLGARPAKSARVITVSGPPPPRGGVAAYPIADSADVALRDGSTLHLRPVSASDKPLVRRFLEGVSQESLGFRFFGTANLDWVRSEE